MDHRKIREMEREYRLLFNMFDNEWKVKVGDVAVEQSGKRLLI